MTQLALVHPLHSTTFLSFFSGKDADQGFDMVWGGTKVAIFISSSPTVRRTAFTFTLATSDSDRQTSRILIR